MKLGWLVVTGAFVVTGFVPGGCSSPSPKTSTDARLDASNDRPRDVPAESMPGSGGADGGAAGGDGAAETADGGGAGTGAEAGSSGGGGGVDGGGAGTGGGAGNDGGANTDAGVDATDVAACDAGLSPAVDGAACKKSNGQACTTTDDCASGFCADGFCCVSACDGACRSCGAAGKQGMCVAVTSGSDDHCVGTCNANGCWKSNGDTCTNAGDCASIICVDGVCCDTTCTGTCKACNVAGKLGTCSTMTGLPDPFSCAGDNVCTSTAGCLPKNGSACTSATSCASGFCVDGVCCDTACTGTCAACNVQGKVGTCSPFPAGRPEGTLCSGASACDGAGACKKANAQTCAAAAECAGNACVGNVCCTGEVCTSPTYVWTKTWGGGDYEFLYGLGAAPDGGFLTMGTYRNGTNVEDVFLVRHDAAGTEVWQRRFGGAKFDTAYGAGFLSDGTVVVGGDITSPTADLDPGAGTFPVTATSVTGFVSKFDSAGGFLWARTWGTTVHGEVYDVAVGPDDSVLVLGLFEGTIDLDPTAGTDMRTGPGAHPGFIVKLSKDGDYVWGRVTTMEAFGKFAVGKDGSVVYVDGFAGMVDLDPTAGVDNRQGQAAYVTKLASDGSYAWSRVFTGAIGALNVAIDDDGSVAVVGEFGITTTFDPAGTVTKTSAGNRDVFATKLNASGTHLWTQALGGVDEEDAESVIFGPGGSVIVSGEYKAAFDSDPGPWIELQPRISTAIGVDVFVTGFSSAGVYQWTRILPSFAFSSHAPMVKVAGGGFLVGATFDGGKDFDSTSGVDSKFSAGQSDAFVTKFLP